MQGDKYEIRFARSHGDLSKIASIRRDVFVREQKILPSEEFDYFDTLEAVEKGIVVQLMVVASGKVIATGRLILQKDTSEDSNFAHIGRMAVRRNFRRKGIGSALMSKFHKIARDLDFNGIVLSAQLHAIFFYLDLGYEERGDVYEDVGIAHQEMVYEFSEP